jgi:hypothetical protein
MSWPVIKRRNPSLQAWRSAGYSHLLFYRLGSDYIKVTIPLRSGDWQALNDLLNRLPEREEFGGAYELYSLKP